MQDLTTAETLSIMNESAFTRIYVRYWAKVYDICSSNLEDGEVAKEMAQDIFKSLWERRQNLEINQSVERYLLRAAKLKVFEYLRNDRIRSSHLKAISYSQHTNFNYTEHEVQRNFLSQKLGALVKALPERGRKIFSMSREMGLTNREIASSLQVTERQVEYQLMKTLQYLRTNLREYSLYLSLIGPALVFFCYF